MNGMQYEVIAHFPDGSRGPARAISDPQGLLDIARECEEVHAEFERAKQAFIAATRRRFSNRTWQASALFQVALDLGIGEKEWDEAWEEERT